PRMRTTGIHPAILIDPHGLRTLRAEVRYNDIADFSGIVPPPRGLRPAIRLPRQRHSAAGTDAGPHGTVGLPGATEVTRRHGVDGRVLTGRRIVIGMIVPHRPTALIEPGRDEPGVAGPRQPLEGVTDRRGRRIVVDDLSRTPGHTAIRRSCQPEEGR